MANSKSIDFGSLVGAQLTALIEAETEGAEKSAEYIESVGFDRKADGTLTLRMVTFDMRRRDTDGIVRTHSIKVPVITLVPIPLLTIEEANIEFELQIESVTTATSEAGGGANSARSSIASLLTGKSRNKLVTRLARTTRDNSTTKSDLKMSVKISQSPFPLGIERLLNTADLSVEDDADA
jgi:hypothetical protein